MKSAAKPRCTCNCPPNQVHAWTCAITEWTHKQFRNLETA